MSAETTVNVAGHAVCAHLRLSDIPTRRRAPRQHGGSGDVMGVIARLPGLSWHQWCHGQQSVTEQLLFQGLQRLSGVALTRSACLSDWQALSLPSQQVRESAGRRHSAGLVHRRIVYSMCRNVRLCTLCVVWWVCGSNEGVYGLLLTRLCLATSLHALRIDKKCVWPTLSALLVLHRYTVVSVLISLKASTR